MANRYSKYVAGSVVGLALSSLLASSAAGPALAFDAPASQANADIPAVAAASRITASVEFSQAAVTGVFRSDIPKRISTIDERERRCWERRVLGRMIHVDCVYWGHVDRGGPVSIRMRGDSISASVPLHGTISAQGIGGLARLLRGTGEASAVVHFDAHPTVRPDWSIDLGLHEGYHWTDEPTLNILGFSIGLTRFVEPEMGRILGSVRGDLEAKASALDLRTKMAAAWQRASQLLKLSDEPVVWMRTTPQTIAFSGFRVRDGMIEASVELVGSTETVVGMEPRPQSPTPLPPLGQTVAQPGGFGLIVPVMISYDTIRQQLAQAFSSVADASGVSVYPSGAKLVVVLQPRGADDAQSIYLTATPDVDLVSRSVIFRDLALAAGSAGAQVTNGLLETVKREFALTYKGSEERIMASANTQFTRPLGGGFRSEGKLTSISAAQARLLPDGLRIDLHANGTLKFVWGF